ncbi:MAG: hypothetical protein K8S14_10580, partial [Actinomycetia bacterium]|nr:hypothetical protein [Actinomycetes bacterium]
EYHEKTHAIIINGGEDRFQLKHYVSHYIAPFQRQEENYENTVRWGVFMQQDEEITDGRIICDDRDAASALAKQISAIISEKS